VASEEWISILFLFCKFWFGNIIPAQVSKKKRKFEFTSITEVTGSTRLGSAQLLTLNSLVQPAISYVSYESYHGAPIVRLSNIGCYQLSIIFTD